MFLKSKGLKIVGSTEYVDIAETKKIPAKIDTGADSSSIWVSNLNVDSDGVLTFSLFDESSSLYVDKILKIKKYSIRKVRSSTGENQIRYCVKLPITLKNETFETNFTLSDRSKNNFPVLIGRHTLKNRFLVDVSKNAVSRQKTVHTKKLNEELKKNPRQFHNKYIKSKKEKK